MAQAYPPAQVTGESARRPVGIDASHAMASIAAGRVSCPVGVADIRRLPFADRSHDAIWCMAVLLHLRRSEAGHALAEARRVLTGDGIVCLGLRIGTGERWETVSYAPTHTRLFTYYSHAEIEQLVIRAGFRRPLLTDMVIRNQTWAMVVTTR